ncbi:hypothetical protein B0H67DRAFT_148650 [Lasiosphaeris hirsuta]|uniref:Heterokaryon incompatibility domain-containing protein n=1 Tax=Lasiosphaeris hirsuta TaxID=260670 RepID=A0AA40DZW9_9PEZI|nr:hypothetical protein B0H67DRAFT_148650 [Lasiosphaeris hirsuta]
MDHPFTSGSLPFGWNSVPGYWPQRLIYIPTMTSAQRDDENVYHLDHLQVREPEYSTLSYTWGRWRIKGKEAATWPALPVKGTPWAIPPVKDEHFTVEAFSNVIQQIAKRGGVEWVWVDIGCIDQRRDDPESNFFNTQAPVEIGRQASIFKRAKNTYVWLCSLDKAELSTAVDAVQQHGLDFSDYLLGPNSKQAIPDELVQNLDDAFSCIFGDPWFSSLWTLQEVVLRNDALVLSAEGEPVPWTRDASHEQNTYLTMFINHCQNVYQDLVSALALQRTWATSWRVSDLAISVMGRTRQQILQAGFYYLFSTNPNVQYGTARYRTTTRNEDRVYAIMQIYNIQVGKSARPKENPALEVLVTEFAGAISQRSAVLGQYFVHTTDPGHRATWQITEESFVPDALMIYRDPVDLATIAAGQRGLAVATGTCCRFPALLQASQEDGVRNSAFARNGMGLDFDVFFDGQGQGERAYAFRYPFRLPVSRGVGSHNGGSEPSQMDYQQVLVLHLGHLQGVPNPNWKQKEFSRRHVGLLLYPVEQGAPGEAVFRRLGVCIWSDRWSGDLLERIEWVAHYNILLQ